MSLLGSNPYQITIERFMPLEPITCIYYKVTWTKDGITKTAIFRASYFIEVVKLFGGDTWRLDVFNLNLSRYIDQAKQTGNFLGKTVAELFNMTKDFIWGKAPKEVEPEDPKWRSEENLQAEYRIRSVHLEVLIDAYLATVVGTLILDYLADQTAIALGEIDTTDPIDLPDFRNNLFEDEK